MKLGIVAKADEPNRVKIARYVHEYLKDKAEVQVQSEVAKAIDADAHGVPIEKMKVDILIAVGGDGTILHAMQRCNAPVFGINLGEFGFLTEAEPIELPDALDRLLSGDYFVENRLKIETRVNDERVPLAVNEAVVKSTKPSKMLQFRVAIGQTEVQRVRADGLIVATPTGSTGYAMSAGGPIIDPRVEALLIAPLAAFTLASRPIVFPMGASLEVRLLDKAKDAVLVVDGQYERPIRSDDHITCTAAAERARFVRFRDTFYPRLKERFS